MSYEEFNKIVKKIFDKSIEVIQSNSENFKSSFQTLPVQFF